MSILAHVCGSSVYYPVVFFGQILEFLSDFYLTFVNGRERIPPCSGISCNLITRGNSSMEGKNGYAKTCITDSPRGNSHISVGAEGKTGDGVENSTVQLFFWLDILL